MNKNTKIFSISCGFSIEKLLIGQRDRTALGKNKAPKEMQGSLGNYPALGKRTASKIKNSQLVEINDVGHLPHIEACQKFIGPLLKFLAK